MALAIGTIPGMEKRYIVLGIGIVAAVGQMMAPIPLWVGIPLLVIGLWFVAWGMLGKPFQEKVSSLAPQLSAAMRGIDSILESFSGHGGSSDAGQDVDKHKRLAAKNTLAACLLKGMQLLSSGATAKDEGYPILVDAWVADTCDKIRAIFGEGEAQIFLNHAGLQFYSSGGQFARSSNLVDGCVQRLNDLIKRCDSILIQ